MSRDLVHSENDGLNIACPVCKAAPGDWCIYVGHSPRAGRETARIHLPRLPRTAAQLLQDFDRREERQLRTWLRRYVHLLLNVTSPPQ